MIIIAGHYTVDPSARDALVETFSDLVARCRGADGCIDTAVTVDSVDPGRVNMLEIWRDAASLDAWRAVANAPDPGVEMRDMTVARYDATDGGPLFP